jgi:RNA polymerase sigma-70 factor, ECF subfamily
LPTVGEGGCRRCFAEMPFVAFRGRAIYGDSAWQRTKGVTHIVDALGSDSRLGRREEFATLLARVDRALFAFVFAMAPNRDEAEELLQETRVVLWEKFDDFATGTNFLAWAYSVARLEVLKYRERCARHRRLFSNAAIEAISGEIRTSGDNVERRHAALQHCLGKLNARHGQLIRDRYVSGMSVDQLAVRLGRSCDAVYHSLSRIRRGLFECIERTLAAGGCS